MKVDLLLKNAEIFDGEKLYRGALGISKGRISFIGTPLSVSGEQEIDLHGLWVLPGGIETHAHIREPELTPRSTFASESIAAAAGGITTFFEMPISAPPQADTATLYARENLAQKKSCVDFAFYGAACGGQQNVEELAKAGVIAFKLFLFDVTGPREMEFKGATAVQDDVLAKAMKTVTSTGKILAIHAENGPLAAWYAGMAKEERRGGPLEQHERSRPVICEVQAVEKILRFAKHFGTRVSFCHISTGEAMSLIAQAKAEGQHVWAESCPQYLYLNYEMADKLGYGPYAKYNPPIRSRQEQEQLWRSLHRGEIDYIGSDHGAFRLDEKEPGEKDIFKAPAGSVGFETRLPLMISSVLKGDLSLKQLVDLTAANAARAFGIFPRKGIIRPGSDADLVILDPGADVIPTRENSYSQGKEIARLYEGWKLKGQVIHTLVRGAFVFKDGAPVQGMAGWGQKVSCI